MLYIFSRLTSRGLALRQLQRASATTYYVSTPRTPSNKQNRSFFRSWTSNKHGTAISATRFLQARSDYSSHRLCRFLAALLSSSTTAALCSESVSFPKVTNNVNRKKNHALIVATSASVNTHTSAHAQSYWLSSLGKEMDFSAKVWKTEWSPLSNSGNELCPLGILMQAAVMMSSLRLLLMKRLGLRQMRKKGTWCTIQDLGGGSDDA